jgi:hypothetical protein
MFARYPEPVNWNFEKNIPISPTYWAGCDGCALREPFLFSVGRDLSFFKQWRFVLLRDVSDCDGVSCVYFLQKSRLSRLLMSVNHGLAGAWMAIPSIGCHALQGRNKLIIAPCLDAD